MNLVKVKFKGGWAWFERGRLGQSRADVGLDGVWELYTEPAAGPNPYAEDKPTDLMDLTKAELVKIAEEKGLEVTDRMNKRQIADLIVGE